MQCVVCGRERPGISLRKAFSGNFTAYPLLSYGNCVCKECYAILHDQKYRRHSWYKPLNGETVFLKRQEVLDFMVNIPETPFYLYLSATGKKQGYLQLLGRPNHSKDLYITALDDMLVTVDISQLREMIQVAKKARNEKFSKAELRGDIKVKHADSPLCDPILRYKGCPLWEVVVWAV